MGSPDSTIDARWRGSWRAEIAVRISELRHRLEVVRKLPTAPSPASVEMVEAVGAERAVVAVELREPGGGAPWGEGRGAHVDAIQSSLDAAETALEVPGIGQRFTRWWSGSSVTVAWESVHDAEAELVELEADDAAAASLPRLEAWMKHVVEDKDLRKRYLDKLAKYVEGEEPIDRGVIRQAYQAVTVENNEKHANVRNFRNRLIVASIVLAVLLLALAVWHALNPDVVPLCGGLPEDQGRLCYGGGSDPNGFAVFEVLLLGSVGGLLSAAFAFGRVRHAPSRYSLRGPQTVLKPIAGAATALFGVLLVLSGLLVSPAEKSEEVLVAYAALFGFAQHLFTRFVDSKADDLIGTEQKTDEDEAKSGGAT